MDYISTKEAAEKWNVSERRIQKLCEDKRIPGTVRFSHVWAKERKKACGWTAKIRTEKS